MLFPLIFKDGGGDQLNASCCNDEDMACVCLCVPGTSVSVLEVVNTAKPLFPDAPSVHVLGDFGVRTLCVNETVAVNAAKGSLLLNVSTRSRPSNLATALNPVEKRDLYVPAASGYTPFGDVSLANKHRPPAPDPLQSVDEEVLQELLMMGFLENHARKALYYTRAGLEEAVDWLAENQENDEMLAAPVKPPELVSGAAVGATGSAGPSAATVHKIPKALQDTIARGLCTFCVTGESFIPQTWYHCVTCGLVEHQGVCVVCANQCHYGHKLSAVRYSERFFCDCGGKCKSL